MSDYLELWRGSGDPVLVPLAGERFTVGKARDCDLAITSDSAVSRVHAVLERFAAGSWVVRDLGSRNGTFVNGERLMQERVLRHHDEVRVGDTRLVYRADSPLHEPTATSTIESPPEVTPRERAVLVELCRPMLAGQVFREPSSVRKIAGALYVTEDAVKQHLRNLYRKFRIDEGEARRRVDLANEAIRRGAVGPADLQQR